MAITKMWSPNIHEVYTVLKIPAYADVIFQHKQLYANYCSTSLFLKEFTPKEDF